MAIKRGGLGRGLDGMFPVYPGRGKGSEEAVADDKEKKIKKSVQSNQTKKKKVESETANVISGNDISEIVVQNDTDQNQVHSENVVNAADTVKNTDSDTPIQEKEANTIAETSQENAVDNEYQVNTSLKTDEHGTVIVRIAEVEPNREQPRKTFDESGLEELAESIRQHGIIQPLIVQKRDDYYEIIAGERRWRAARIAGLKEVPVVIKDYSDKEILEVSLIENIQREDLNPVEEAKAYQRLLTEFNMKQEEVAERVSKNRTTITNSLRLLKLDERVQQLLIEDTISAGHARAILALEEHDSQYRLALQVIDNNMSVRDTERAVRKILHPEPETTKPQISESLAAIYADMEEKLKAALGTKVVLNHKTEQKGKIEIEYYSNDELERIFELLRK